MGGLQGFLVGFRGSRYRHTWPAHEANGAGAKSAFTKSFHNQGQKAEAEQLCLITPLIYRAIIVTLLNVSPLPNERQWLHSDAAGAFT